MIRMVAVGMKVRGQLSFSLGLLPLFPYFLPSFFSITYTHIHFCQLSLTIISLPCVIASKSLIKCLQQVRLKIALFQVPLRDLPTGQYQSINWQSFCQLPIPLDKSSHQVLYQCIKSHTEVSIKCLYFIYFVYRINLLQQYQKLGVICFSDQKKEKGPLFVIFKTLFKS